MTNYIINYYSKLSRDLFFNGDQFVSNANYAFLKLKKKEKKKVIQTFLKTIELSVLVIKT